MIAKPPNLEEPVTKPCLYSGSFPNLNLERDIKKIYVISPFTPVTKTVKTVINVPRLFLFSLLTALSLLNYFKIALNAAIEAIL